MRQGSRVWLVGFFALSASVASAAPATGVAAEREEVRIEKTFSRAPFADDYLTGIARRITTAAGQTFAVEVDARAVRSDAPFVFALGNGTTYISTGLIARVANESQLAVLLAPELASVLAPNTELEATHDKKNKRNAGIKMLAVIATAGIAAFPIVSAENKAYSAQYTEVVLDNDKTALRWARAAGFDIRQAPLVTQRLKDLLAAEHVSGASRLANAAGLETRGTQLAAAVSALEAEPSSNAVAADSPEPLRQLSRRLAIDLVVLDFERNDRAGIVPLLERIDREYGPAADTACLRARFLRQQPTSAQIPRETILAYEACVAAPDAAAANHRELAFLYRESGDAAAARKSFEKYLELAPQAVDAPIIKMYIEELRAKP
jgi:beta-barrel assembly-enhancing protease